MAQGRQGTDLDRVRSRAATLSGEALWRSMDELADTPEFRESMEREFPASVIQRLGLNGDWNEQSRRNFLKVMGASIALAGVYGCSERPSSKILPYVNPPEQIVPGMPLMFASTMPLNGYGLGILAHSQEGRPIKIEGNPDHPASLGGTNVFMQASVLQLYDPERSRNATRAGVASSWDAFGRELREVMERKRASGGDKLRILTGTVTSPTFAWQIQQFLKQFPQARWHVYDPMARGNTRQGAQAAFGRPVNTRYIFRTEGAKPEDRVEAKVILSLDSDFLWAEPGSVRYAREFAETRKVRVRHAWRTEMSRLYVVESTFSITGAMADHRVPATPTDVALFARAVAAKLGTGGVGSVKVPASWAKVIDVLVADLQQNRGASLITVGESMPPEIHALGHALNAALGNVGKTILYTEPVDVVPNGSETSTGTFDSLRALTDDMNAGRVDTLLIFGENPAYTAPGDIPFGEALLRLSRPQQNNSAAFVNFTAHLGLYGFETNETAANCLWHLPEAHYLESWGDVRAFDGTASIIQPLIAPLYGGRGAIEVMDDLLTPPSQFRSRGGYEIVREYWRTQVRDDLEAWWSKTLERGMVENSAAKPIEQLTPNITQAGGSSPTTASTSAPANALQVVFRPDPSAWDGQFANNGWLQETPRFFTKLVWDNAALISPRTADTLRTQISRELSDGHILTLRNGNLSVNAPVMIVPGIPDNAIVVTFGYGHTRGGTCAMDPDGRTPRGFNAYAIRDSRSPWFATPVEVKATGDFRQLVTTHNHHAMDVLPDWGSNDVRGKRKPQAVEHPDMPDEQETEIHNRKLVRTATLDYFKQNRHFVQELGDESEKKPLLDIYPGWDYSKGYQWGMSIDMQSCIGCNACLVACVAENNIAVVGKDEVARQREMHWIRIDQYFATSLSEEQIKNASDPLDVLANPRVYHQPVPCMHCENAPCELVCPVGATTHSPEGLNEMTYNRCVGTRYCSNNCPYKVRRFNFFNWHKGAPDTLDLQHNPQVTVRTRGVMEKCTYCVQRINNTRIEIEKMIVRNEEQVRRLEKEMRETGNDWLSQEIANLKRQRHNQEFGALENLQTACQQACPTEAIVFGNTLPVVTVNENHEQVPQLTKVTKLKQEPLNYGLLMDLTTKPRTTYMARLRNPNPTLEPDAKA